jgi:predicted RecA/RadA family phage recombinase
MAGEACLEVSPHTEIKYTAGGAVTEGDVIAGATGGTWDVKKLAHATDEAWVLGEAIFWDDSAKNFCTTAASNTFAGVAAEAAVSTATRGRLLLNRGVNAA